MYARCTRLMRARPQIRRAYFVLSVLISPENPAMASSDNAQPIAICSYR